jgi:Flp pilus assembly protein TadD
VAVIDAGRPSVDAGKPDAGTAVDSGTPTVDAGVKPTVDAGSAMVATAVVDAGKPAVDAGSVAVASEETVLNDARAALVAGRYNSAITLFRKALKAQPENTEARTGLGISLVLSETSNGYVEAAPYLEAAVKANPKNAQAWFALGMAQDNNRKPAEAKEAFRNYLNLVPKGPRSDEVREALRLMK